MDDRELLADRIRMILRGIDKDECYDPDGWWETSTGAEFGAKKLAEVLAAIGVLAPGCAAASLAEGEAK